MRCNAEIVIQAQNSNDMKRKDFLRRGIFGLGSIVALPSAISSCNEARAAETSANCSLSPSETAGPFPIKTPAQLVQSNIIADRRGVALLMTITVKDQSNSCKPLPNVHVDVWQCDKDGYYSEYGGVRMQKLDLRDQHFLRGRQMTDENGQVSFISIFPGWYPGRAPHIHVEVLDEHEKSIRITQIAFPEDVIDLVYATDDYPGAADTSNSRDGVFRNSLKDNMADEVKGNVTDGYVLTKTLIV